MSEIRSAAGRVLVIVVARIGDTLLVTPALRAIGQAFPGGRLVVMAHPKRKAVLEHLPFVGEVKSITKHSARLKGWLGRSRFDIAFVYGADASLVAYALRVARRVYAFDRLGDAIISPRLTSVAPPSASLHAVEERLLLPRAAGIEASDMRLAYRVTPAEQARARDWIARHIGHEAHPLIGIQMFSFPTKSHRDWPVGHFIELMQRTIARYNNSRFVILGDKSARARCAEVLRALPQHVVIAAGRFSLRENAAIIQQLDLYVGVDTGPTHIAGALGVNMVALYHYSYPGRNLAPLAHPGCRSIEHPQTLVPGRHEAGMEQISVDRVWEEARALLEARTQASSP